jgi:hypothetical protein
MKQYLSILFLLLGVSAASATIRVVDGVGASGSGRFAKISDAVTAAATNDTIVVLPGIYREAEISVDKRLTIIGSGYREVKNGGTHLLGMGFSLTDAADGAKIQGFKFLGQGVSLGGSADNCLIANNFFLNAYIYFQGSTGDTVRNNIFVMTANSVAVTTAYNTGLTNVVIANNIISGFGQTGGVAAFGIRTQAVNTVNLQLLNNFVEKYQYFYTNDFGHQSGVVIAGNIFHKIATISPYSTTPALLYSGNWKLNMTVGALEPTSGTDNGSGDITSMFNRFDQNFDFKDSPSTDTDFRFKSSTTPYPDSPVDGSAQAIAPLGSWYVDYIQQPGTSNSNRADGGIYGGPFPFPSHYGAALLPAVTNLTVSPAVAAPNGTIQINATGTVIGYPGRNN